ncbi:MAG: hypothetical protein JWM44_4539 [Bacilli bacterium]|nr:hypothetical protein [Bacilli bacterium]
MKKSVTNFLIMMLLGMVLLLSGCFNHTPSVTSSMQPTIQEISPEIISLPSPSFSASTSPSPSPMAASAAPAPQTENVRIQLDAEPSLHSPIKTLVSTLPQTYTITFAADMDRASVESALQQHLKVVEFHKPADAYLSFHWDNDRLLKLGLELKNYKGTDIAPVSYRLDVNGAQTANKQKLEHPPAFEAVLFDPHQIWRISADGKTVEQQSNFTEPAYFQLLEGDPRYALIKRATTYCECDATYPLLYSVYDLLEKKLVSYPVQLQTDYRGPGDFVVDTRGFFYTKADAPKSDTAYSIHLDDYIYGAHISQDRQHVIMAVGPVGAEKDLDLFIYNLLDGTKKVVPKALLGATFESQVSSRKEPVLFKDIGGHIYFTMLEPVAYKQLRYSYSWVTQQVSAWKLPSFADEAYNFSGSGDGKFRLYGNEWLAKDDEKISNQAIPNGGSWLFGTHSYVFEGAPSTLKMYDADQNKLMIIKDLLPKGSYYIGSSLDGKWNYIVSGHIL